MLTALRRSRNVELERSRGELHEIIAATCLTARAELSERRRSHVEAAGSIAHFWGEGGSGKGSYNIAVSPQGTAASLVTKRDVADVAENYARHRPGVPLEVAQEGHIEGQLWPLTLCRDKKVQTGTVSVCPAGAWSGNSDDLIVRVGARLLAGIWQYGFKERLFPGGILLETSPRGFKLSIRPVHCDYPQQIANGFCETLPADGKIIVQYLGLLDSQKPACSYERIRERVLESLSPG